MRGRLQDFLIVITLISCSSSMRDTFNSQELISSKGERIYINSLNWGMTDDHQMSIITRDPSRLKERSDSAGVVFGLEPFIYSFENDTLKLIFEDRVNYTVTDAFETIEVKYIALKGNEFSNIRSRSYNNDGFYSVPKRTEKNYPSDRPKAPKH